MTKERFQLNILPISYTRCDNVGDYGDFQFYDVEFEANWGPFTRKMTFASLVLYLSRGILEIHDVYNSKGDKAVAKFKVEIVPIRS